LLRHGHTAWNRAGRIQGRVDEPLDAQARDHLAGLRLPDELADAAVVASPLCRAIDTARLVSGRMPQIVPELTEMDWGEWQGLRSLELVAEESSGYRHIEDWGWNFQPPGGETPKMVWDRVEPWIASAQGLLVAVCHVGVMRVLLARASGWEFSGPAPFQVKRDRLYIITVDDDALMFDGEPVRLIRSDPQ
jgi:probable phosphoglycerate mutase